MKIFNSEAKISNRLTEHKKGYDVFLALYWCVLFPIFSVIVCTLDGQPAIYKSLSYVAYRENHMAIIYIYGSVFVIGFIATLYACLSMGQYSKSAKVIFLTLAGLSAIILTAGISVPWLEVEGELADRYEYLRHVHNGVSTTGFVLFFVTELLFFITTIARNRKQGLISFGLLAFVLVTAVFMITKANLKGVLESAYPISAIAQSYMFCMMGFTMTIQYYLMSMLPNEKFAEQSEHTC